MISPKVTQYTQTGLAAAPDVLDALLSGMTPGEWDAQPDSERFTLREMVAHLADWEGVWLERIRAMQEQDHPHLPGYDEGQWALDHDYAHSDFAAQLAKFRAGREALCAYLAALPPEGWERTATHAEWGEVHSVVEVAALVQGHDGYHFRQVIEFRGLSL